MSSSDISMPGLTMALARVPPVSPVGRAVVFVTAYDQYVNDAFAVDAIDHVMKFVRPERLAEWCAGRRLP